MDLEMAACAADGVALAPSEIAQVKSFMATDLGRRFWDASALSLLPLKNCYRAVLRLIVTDADYRAAGVRPPAPIPAVPHEDR